MRVRWSRPAWPRLPNQTRRGRNLPRVHSRQPAAQPSNRCRSKAGFRHLEANIQFLNHQGDSGNLVSMAQTKVRPKGRCGTVVPFGFGPACLRLLLNLTVPVGKLAYRMPSSMTRCMRLGTANSIRSGNPTTTWTPAINRWYGVWDRPCVEMVCVGRRPKAQGTRLDRRCIAGGRRTAVR